MDNFEAFIRGTRQDGVITYYSRVSPTDFGIEEEYGDAFRLGLELNACLQMVMSADSEREYVKDVTDYDDCVESVNKLFGFPVAKSWDHKDFRPISFINPKTKGEHLAEFGVDARRH